MELNSKLALANIWPSGLEKLASETLTVPAEDKSMVPLQRVYFQASINCKGRGGVCDHVTTSRVARFTFVRVIDLYIYIYVK